MAIRVSFQNSGGELDFRVVKNEDAAVAALVEMAEMAGSLNDGDRFVVSEVQD